MRRNLKKIMLVFTLVILFFIKVISVSASEVTWNDITAEMQKSMNESAYTAAIEDNNLIITWKNEEDSYITTFTYLDGIIKLKQRDTTNLSDKEKLNYALTDMVGLIYLLNTVSTLNDVDFSLLDEEKLDTYGITFKVGEEVSYTEEESNLTSTVTYTEEFSLNLDQFEVGTASLKGTLNEKESNDITVTKPSLNVSLAKAEESSIELAIHISELSNLMNSTAICDIYSMPTSGGESHLIGSMACKEGETRYTVSNLEANTSYSFMVHLRYTWGMENLETEDSIYSNWINFSTTEKELTNPKTGTTFIYIIFITCVLSMVAIISTYQKIRRENSI